MPIIYLALLYRNDAVETTRGRCELACSPPFRIQFEAKACTQAKNAPGASLATDTGASALGASRLKGGCSQDWLPHSYLFAAARGGLTDIHASGF
jgi:hypothetical protein